MVNWTTIINDSIDNNNNNTKSNIISYQNFIPPFLINNNNIQFDLLKYYSHGLHQIITILILFCFVGTIIGITVNKNLKYSLLYNKQGKKSYKQKNDSNTKNNSIVNENTSLIQYK